MTIVTEPSSQHASHLSESAMPASTLSNSAKNQRSKKSEPEPFDLGGLVAEHQAEIWRYLRYLGARPAEADDLTQEAFLEVARKPFIEKTRPESASYLRAVARNQLLMLRRKQRREGQQIDLDVAESVWSETLWADQNQPTFWNEYENSLLACTQKLEGKSSQVIELFYRQKTSREKIAESLGMKPDGVKTLLRRVRQKLRECVERQQAASGS